MDIFGGLLLFISFIALIVFLILTIVSLVKKNGKVKRQLMFAGGSFLLMIVGFIMIGSSTDVDTTASNEVKQEEAEPEEKKLTPEEEAAKKAEEEAEAKAKAEQKAKEEEEARIAAEQAAAEKKANAQPIEYAQLTKNPDRHAGTYVKYTGEIIQIQEGDNYTVIRLAVTQESYGYNPNDIVWVEYEGYTDYVDGDIITTYGEIIGSHSYTSQAGWDITLPAMLADTFE
jgi:hypothetical protein